MATRNITLALPEDVVRQAKVLAAQRDTSVSALVTELLTQLVGNTPSYDIVWAQEEILMDEGIGLQVGEITWSREDVHQR